MAAKNQQQKLVISKFSYFLESLSRGFFASQNLPSGPQAPSHDLQLEHHLTLSSPSTKSKPTDSCLHREGKSHVFLCHLQSLQNFGLSVIPSHRRLDSALS
jgi:hypothetical protein